MADDMEYSYSATKHHMEPFVNLNERKAFISEMEATFGKLWLFKPHINSWSFGVSHWKNYVYLRYRIQGTTQYLPWNVKEKVILINDYEGKYVVLMLREVDDNGKPGHHCHSMLVNVDASHVMY